MYSWRHLPEMPLEEYEQLILDYSNYPDGSSSSSSCVDSDQAFWCEDDPEVHFLDAEHDGAGLVAGFSRTRNRHRERILRSREVGA
jgi:hypothetical protein